MGPLLLRRLPVCLSSKAVFADLADLLFMTTVGVVAIVEAPVLIAVCAIWAFVWVFLLVLLQL